MTKRLYTAEVLEAILEDLDDDQDYDDLIMEGYDDEFSDLELEEDHADIDLPPPSPLMQCQPHLHSSPSDTSPSSSMFSSPPPATWTSISNQLKCSHSSHQWVLQWWFPSPPERSWRCLVMTWWSWWQQSNRYAKEVMGSEKFATWMKITLDDMKAWRPFLGSQSSRESTSYLQSRTTGRSTCTAVR